MRLRTLALLLALAGMAGMAWAVPPELNNGVTADENGTVVTFNNAHGAILFQNLGANPVWVKWWQGCETPAAILTTTPTAVKLSAGDPPLSVGFDPRFECGLGYRGISFITAAGVTTTLKYIVK